MSDEKLKEEIKQVVTNLGNIEFTIEDELEFCKQVLKRKEQECEELKEELEAIYDDCKGCSTCNEALYNANLYAKEYRKLSQTLTEIKEIAEELLQTKIPFCEIYGRIMDKISEVENE